MKVQEFINENGSVHVMLVSERGEQLCFWNPNIYNNGKWEIQSYIKKDNYNEEEFSIVTARDGEIFKQICYTSSDYSRIIDCYDNKVKGEIIINKSQNSRMNFYPDPIFLKTSDIRTYLLQRKEYHDLKDNVFSGDLDKSTKAILSYVEYAKLFCKLLKEVIEEEIKKMDKKLEIDPRVLIAVDGNMPLK